MEDRNKRVIKVNRKQLLETLKNNRERHVLEHAEAIAGYKQDRREKLERAFKDAEKSLAKRKKQLLEATDEIVEEDIINQRDYVQIIQSINLDLSVPKSYEKDYDAAIDMAAWDTRDELELTYAEFTCFVRDCWDWSEEFNYRNSVYLSKV